MLKAAVDGVHFSSLPQASAIMFLATEDSAWTAGATLVVDGGITL
jgi:NAD(P)-dependent dehydrogenase (short-subunit alcohol dehydrogenase family)